MKKIALCTLFTGFNYGSSLQAFALKTIINSKGYVPIILKEEGSIVGGRDFRLKKLFSIGTRIILHPFVTKTAVKSYLNSFNKKISIEKKMEFLSFSNDYLSPLFLSKNEIKKMSKNPEFVAFVCGSDQVWNSTALYIDPFYYLRYCDSEKRIAFSVSFGKNYIWDINKPKMAKYINGFRYISVREFSGVGLIDDLCGKSALNTIDPTLVIRKREWQEMFNLTETANKTIVLYFLSQPSDRAKKFISLLEKKYSDYEFLLISDDDYFVGKYKRLNKIGPIGFLNYFLSASMIVTDSFHGVAFSINFNKDFYAFDRDYQGGVKQSDRIESILKMFHLTNRFDCSDVLDVSIDFNQINLILEEQSKKAKDFLFNSLESIEGGAKQ